jgi:hypothetical protein
MVNEKLHCRKRGKERTLSTLLPTTIRTTSLFTYVSSSENQRGNASNDSRFETSYTARLIELI